MEKFPHLEEQSCYVGGIVEGILATGKLKLPGNEKL